MLAGHPSKQTSTTTTTTTTTATSATTSTATTIMITATATASSAASSLQQYHHCRCWAATNATPTDASMTKDKHRPVVGRFLPTVYLHQQPLTTATPLLLQLGTSAARLIGRSSMRMLNQHKSRCYCKSFTSQCACTCTTT